MFKATLIVLGLFAIGGTALATGQHDYNKSKKPCILEVTDSPKIHNKHCKPQGTPVVTPTPGVTPEVTPTPEATPEVTPEVTPGSTPAATSTVKIQASTVLPSVGADGR